MAICKTPALSETVDVQTPSEAHQLALQWRRNGGTGAFMHEGPRLLSVADFLRDCAERASTQSVVQAFTHESRATEKKGRQRMSETGVADMINEAVSEAADDGVYQLRPTLPHQEN